MASYPLLTRNDRAYRRERIVAFYQREPVGSRAVADHFGLSDGYVRAVVREAGVARKRGRPFQFLKGDAGLA